MQDQHQIRSSSNGISRPEQLSLNLTDGVGGRHGHCPTPSGGGGYLNNCDTFKVPEGADPRLLDELGELRQQIDVLDDHLIDLLERRMQIADKIGFFKKKNNITVLQSARWDEIISKVIARGNSKGLSSELIDTIFKAIHQESINRQIRIVNNGLENNNKEKSKETSDLKDLHNKT